MRLGTICLLTLLLAFGQQVMADMPPQYFGIFASDAQFDPDNGSKVDETNIGLKLGYDFSKYWGMEVHGGKSVSENESVDGDGVIYAAAMLRGNLPFKRVNVYGMLGFGAINVDYPGNFEDEYAGLATGFGIELFGTQTTALGIEYFQVGSGDIYKMIGLGIVHHFNWPEFR